jgi:molybdopterin synthase sulfur carrier subunit
MEIKVLYFGQAADITHKSEQKILSITSTTALNQYLQHEYAGLKKLPYRLSLNHIVISEETILKDGDIVGVLPPFSGG